MMPSSIPATPFETNGADFTAEDMKQWKDHPLVLGLGRSDVLSSGSKQRRADHEEIRAV